MSSSIYLKPLKQVLRHLPDRAYIQLYYFAKFGKFCNLRNPSTFNEKLQWLKLNYRIISDQKLVDKSEVKQIVEQKIGKEYIVPTLALYDNAEQIDFSSLPDSFVLKCTHDSEGVVIVEDKKDLDLDAAREKLRRALKQNFYPIGREPHYRDLEPKIIAEPYLKDEVHGQLLDYKFFCFDGEVKAMFVASDRVSGNTKFDYFDADYHPLEMQQAYPNSSSRPSKPQRYQEMLDISRILSAGHPHVRVDLYEVNGRVYFGELTFFHFSGFSPFKPKEWDQRWGDLISLPVARVEY
ncbi:ATP-grasp fold amidoligase family protein [Glutamicibacter sp.]|uniref:ATP-grasp fold amidoligase family protein n=1 Tax=Glutamicibacter sp. TaxID=1931995 RepID=UPI0028BDA7A7|nr:ATP-grasp fold amidoligase family protein [Glutamicibacter sp.]